MRQKKPKAYDNSWIGNINAAAVATLYEGKRVIGTCMDCPNPVAYAFKHTAATHAVSRFSRFKRGKKEGYEASDKQGFCLLSPSRINAGGWLTAEKAFLKLNEKV